MGDIHPPYELEGFAQGMRIQKTDEGGHVQFFIPEFRPGDELECDISISEYDIEQTEQVSDGDGITIEVQVDKG